MYAFIYLQVNCNYGSYIYTGTNKITKGQFSNSQFRHMLHTRSKMYMTTCEFVYIRSCWFDAFSVHPFLLPSSSDQWSGRRMQAWPHDFHKAIELENVLHAKITTWKVHVRRNAEQTSHNIS